MLNEGKLFQSVAFTDSPPVFGMCTKSILAQGILSAYLYIIIERYRTSQRRRLDIYFFRIILCRRICKWFLAYKKPWHERTKMKVELEKKCNWVQKIENSVHWVQCPNFNDQKIVIIVSWPLRAQKRVQKMTIPCVSIPKKYRSLKAEGRKSH